MEKTVSVTLPLNLGSFTFGGADYNASQAAIAQAQAQAATQSAAESEKGQSNTVKFIIIGAVTLAVLVLLIYAFKR